MKTEHGKNRQTEERKTGDDNIRHFEGFTGILGTSKATSTELGTYQVGASRENSNKSNTPIFRGESIEGVAGKLISQLICEAKKQLAYHEQQATLLRDRIEELEQISEVTDT